MLEISRCHSQLTYHLGSVNGSFGFRHCAKHVYVKRENAPYELQVQQVMQSGLPTPTTIAPQPMQAPAVTSAPPQIAPVAPQQQPQQAPQYQQQPPINTNQQQPQQPPYAPPAGYPQQQQQYAPYSQNAPPQQYQGFRLFHAKALKKGERGKGKALKKKNKQRK